MNCLRHTIARQVLRQLAAKFAGIQFTATFHEAVLSSAKAQNEEYKMNECKLKITLEHSREFTRTRGYKNPPLDYSKCNKYAPPKPATKKAKTKSIKFDPDKIRAQLDKVIRPRTKPERKAAVNRIEKLLGRSGHSPAKEPAPRPAWREPRSIPMKMSEIAHILYQIEKCWSIPDARVAENLVVRIKIFLNTDGTQSKSPEILGDRYKTGDPIYDAAAESARQSVWRCQPLKNLLADKYAHWKEVTISFNPRKMLNSRAKEPAPRPAVTMSTSRPLTRSVIDNIRHQIEKCWSIPAGVGDEGLIVRIKFFLNTDGSLSKAPEIVGDRPKTGDTNYDAVAESARRAVLKCAPFKNMPVDKYPRWRKIIITFYPRSMVGG
jgi:hypothetical protein